MRDGRMGLGVFPDRLRERDESVDMITERPTITEEITDIQRRMAQIRRDMHHEVQGAVRGAQSLTDWRSLLGSHPWLSLGLAAALGYLIVPRRRSLPRAIVTAGPPPDPVTPPVTTHETDLQRSSSWNILSMAYTLLAPVAAPAAQNYPLDHLEQWL